MPRRGFKTKHDALRLAVHVWTCQHCGTQHRKVKPTMCNNCGVGAFDHFDSIGEANKYAELALKQKLGMISDLQTQVRFPIYQDWINGKPALTTEKKGKLHRTYVADFVYTDKNGKTVIADYKGNIGHVTDVFSLKKHDVEWLYQVEILLI